MTPLTDAARTLAAMLIESTNSDSDHHQIAALRDEHDSGVENDYTAALDEALGLLTTPSATVSRVAMVEALAEAAGWAEHGYSVESRHYWRGIRDTLLVVLGVTTVIPTVTGPDTDVAALTLLGAQRRLTQRADAKSKSVPQPNKGQTWRHRVTGDRVTVLGHRGDRVVARNDKTVVELAPADFRTDYAYVSCNHDVACCATHSVHVSPHQGCVLR